MPLFPPAVDAPPLDARTLSRSDYAAAKWALSYPQQRATVAVIPLTADPVTGVMPKPLDIRSMTPAAYAVALAAIGLRR